MPKRTRTPSPGIRNPLLYPFELPAHMEIPRRVELLILVLQTRALSVWLWYHLVAVVGVEPTRVYPTVFETAPSTNSSTPPFGGDGGDRTHNTQLLRLVRLPIAPHPHMSRYIAQSSLNTRSCGQPHNNGLYSTWATSLRAVNTQKVISTFKHPSIFDIGVWGA